MDKLRDSGSASVPHTVETVFMSNEKSPQRLVAAQEINSP